MGAFASFTCGTFGSRGGMAAQVGRPGGQDLYIGVKDGSRFDGGPIRCLPFFRSATVGGAGAADFQVEQANAGPVEQHVAHGVIALSANEVTRHYGWATDRWVTEGFTFTVYTPFGEIPDPSRADPARMRDALCPAVVAELEVDNTRGLRPRTAVFAMNFNEPGWLPVDGAGPGRRGFSLRSQFGILGEVVGGQSHAMHGHTINGHAMNGLSGNGHRRAELPQPALFCRWSPDQGLAEAVPHRLGSCPGLCVEVPPGQRLVLRLALGWYLGGVVTTGREGRYLYARHYTGLADVLASALARGDPAPACDAIDRRLTTSGLSGDQQFQVAHATRSYYGSTQLLEVGGRPTWVVNEGEYCMMNTLDLGVDQMFWELDRNPWVVRNLLDGFARHYSYVDGLKGPGGQTLPGGISFTHDQGAHNNFSPRGQSSYELPELDAVCFSFMTAEQLANWVLMAATYVTATGDSNWARQNGHVLLACLDSLRNRGGTGAIPEFDSTRCGTHGAEITTYDSLDHSLAQTRNNLYMAVKFWAAFRGLATLFDRLGGPAWLDARGIALALAERAAQTVCGQAGPDGVIPAVFEPDNTGYHSRILPAVEGLLYPHVWGENVATIAPALYAALRRHTLALLTDPQRRNVFPDGGIKLSSTSDNSWMSKIALFQHVARTVLCLDADPAVAELLARADAAHVAWQTQGSGYWACSDQFVNGVAKGSRYYPRVVTAALWFRHAGDDLRRGVTVVAANRG
jgi:hypothetical protein